ncbi:peritrophin-1-like [Anopheles bellator]|uniref:peritrophin-1-like n=1 Tax=Anopheles bellator TaxID=139047 RepID=UPI002648BC2E|nr:peritrophin-1-like [Anopheles bellator]
MIANRILSRAVFCSAVMLLLLDVGIVAQDFNPMEICQGKPDETKVLNPLSCEQFLLCQNGMPAGTGQCPTDMLFNAADEICDFPDKVDCGSVPLPPWFEDLTTTTSGTGTTPATTAGTGTTASPTASCPTVDDPLRPTYLPVPTDCSSYVLCYHGNPIAMKCPTVLQWNKATMTCDSPENAKCQVRTGAMVTAIRSITTRDVYSIQAIFENPYGCPLEGSSILPHPEKCGKYIFCLHGIARVQVCQMFKYFDPVLGECVFGTC